MAPRTAAAILISPAHGRHTCADSVMTVHFGMPGGNRKRRKRQCFQVFERFRGQDSNLRPSGYAVGRSGGPISFSTDRYRLTCASARAGLLTMCLRLSTCHAGQGTILAIEDFHELSVGCRSALPTACGHPFCSAIRSSTRCLPTGVSMRLSRRISPPSRPGTKARKKPLSNVAEGRHERTEWPSLGNRWASMRACL